MCRILLLFLLFFPLCVWADLASTRYVDERVTAQVQTTGNQEISGVKTYIESPIVPTPPFPPLE